MNNKVLTIILVILLGLFIANKLFKGTQTVSFDKTFASLDAEQIDQIIVYAKSSNPTYELRKEDAIWVGYYEGQKYRLNESRTNSFISAISDIQIKRLAAKSKEKWAQFEVGEETGFRIKVLNDAKPVLDFVVGRFSFDQQSRTATSYLRKTAEDEVFAMDGFTSMTLNQDFSGLRYNKVIDLEGSAGLEQVQIKEGDESYTIQKNGNSWTDIFGRSLDSVKVIGYISGIESLTSNSFVETFGGEPDVTVSLELQNGDSKLISITKDSTEFIVKSAEENIYFKSDSAGIFKKIVLDLKDLLSPVD